jgi:hypothetical protein
MALVESRNPASGPVLLLQKLALVGGPTVTMRDLRRRDWAGLRGAKLEHGLRELEAGGWVRRSTTQPTTGGTPSEIIEIHPSLPQLIANLADAA